MPRRIAFETSKPRFQFNTRVPSLVSPHKKMAQLAFHFADLGRCLWLW